MRINREDIITAYKYVKDGAILLETQNKGLSKKEVMLKMDMIRNKFEKLGYFYKIYVSGVILKSGETSYNVSYLFPYPNATVETFGEMVVKLQRLADEYDYNCFLCDSIESDEYLSFCDKNVA